MKNPRGILGGSPARKPEADEKLEFLFFVLFFFVFLLFRVCHIHHLDNYQSISIPLRIMKGKNECQWLLLGLTDRCNRRCMGTFCKVHLARLRKFPGTKPCRGCGKGVKNKHELCINCGYRTIVNTNWYRAHRCIQKEFSKLAAIEIFN